MQQVEFLESRRLMSAGLPDTNFASGGVLTASLSSEDAVLATRPDGRIVVASLERSNEGASLVVRQYLADGTPDITFGAQAQPQPPAGGAAVATSSIRAAGMPCTLSNVGVDGDGAIIIVGITPSSDGATDLSVVKLTANGALDETFGGASHASPGDAAGIATVDVFGGWDTPLSLAVIQNQLIAVPVLTSQGTFAVLLKPDGSRVSDVNGNGVVPLTLPDATAFKDVVVTDNGTVYFCGVSGASVRIFRQGPDGEMDNTFGENGIITEAVPGLTPDAAAGSYGGPIQLSVLADGRFMILSRPTDAAGSAKAVYLSRYSAAGRLDDSFGDAGTARIVTGDEINAVDLAMSGEDPLVLTGSSTSDSLKALRVRRLEGDDGTTLSESGTAVVSGSGDADVIAVRYRGRDGRIVFDVNGNVRSFAASAIRHIEINGFGGNDRISIEGAVPGTFIDAGAGDDSVTGGDGDDLIVGNLGDDVLIGGSGNDTITGNYGNDYLLGSAGRDFLAGGAGRDTLRGAGGNDRLFGGAGMADQLNGGSGFDIASKKPADAVSDIELLAA